MPPNIWIARSTTRQAVSVPRSLQAEASTFPGAPASTFAAAS